MSINFARSGRFFMRYNIKNNPIIIWFSKTYILIYYAFDFFCYQMMIPLFLYRHSFASDNFNMISCFFQSNFLDSFIILILLHFKSLFLLNWLSYCFTKQISVWLLLSNFQKKKTMLFPIKFWKNTPSILSINLSWLLLSNKFHPTSFILNLQKVVLKSNLIKQLTIISKFTVNFFLDSIAVIYFGTFPRTYVFLLF